MSSNSELPVAKPERHDLTEAQFDSIEPFSIEEWRERQEDIVKALELLVAGKITLADLEPAVPELEYVA